jgi:small-conductance mechanosensitive channel
MRFLFTICIGVAATLAWQTYGDQAREIIASSNPQLAWLAPRTTVGQAPLATAARSNDLQLQELSLVLAALRQRVDQLAFQQEQMTRDISAKVQAAQRDILDKIAATQPKPAEMTAARRPAPATPQGQPTQLR